MSRARTQRGIALITALILVAVAAIVATAIAFNSAMSSRRAVATFGLDQSLLVAEGAEAMAAYALKVTTSTARQVSLDEEWAKPYGPVQIDADVTLEASIEDEQGKFNINNLVVSSTGATDPAAVTELSQLLTLLGLETKWAPLLADWIDSDINPNFPDGAEDPTYLGEDPPHRTPNMPVTSISELLAMPGFGRDRYNLLAPYITALPSGTTVNVCTAPGIVLDAMIPGGKQEFSLDSANLPDRRQMGCFPTLAEFQTTMTQSQSGTAMQRVGEGSNYFRLRSWITIGTARFTLYSLLLRDGSGQIRPILRTFGTE